MKKAPLLLLTSAALFLSAGQPAGADAPPRYRLTILPLTFHDSSDWLHLAPLAGGGINNQGQVCGETSVRSGRLGNSHVAIWQKGHSTIVLDRAPVSSDPKGKDSSISEYTFAAGINAYGEVVGDNYLTFSGDYSGPLSRAYVWFGGRMEEIKALPFECDGFASGINDKGWVIGDYGYAKQMPTVDDPPPLPTAAGTHLFPAAFLLRGGRVTPLWQGTALGINNQGWIVGTQSSGGFEGSQDRGVLWRNGHITFLKMQPVAVNGRGEIAGNVPVTEDAGRACVWRRGRVTLLSKRMSRAYALNGPGEVVGEQDDHTPAHAGRATLWRGGRTYDLNRCTMRPRGWVLAAALGINDKGWIIGEGGIYKSLGDKRPARQFTFLLTPR